MPNRSEMIDVLRAVACFVVLGAHLPAIYLGRPILRAWHQGGGIGVTLFFVLSGYLVSGLLFREYRKRGELSIGRFLVRRGFKIYPAFYVFLIASALVLHSTWKAIAVEAAFVSNYSHLFGNARIWDHTWSLAVEEHFYIAIAGLFWLLTARREDHFKAIPWIMGGIVAFCTAMTWQAVSTHTGTDLRPTYTPTHLASSGLCCGVVIAWAADRYPGFLPIVARVRWLVLAAGIAAIVPLFARDMKGDSLPVVMSICNLALTGCIGVVLWSLTEHGGGAIGNAVATVGAYSYSIYLWHMPVLNWFVMPLFDGVSGYVFVPVYVVAAFGCGVLFSLLIEWPVLRLRDRWFPSRSNPI
jgi:peptidoglycan/LPS O-acetylase OafA/YrhL